jgi:hypothetical protein
MTNAKQIRAVVFAAAVTVIVLLIYRPAASQDGSLSKPACIGCSVDGKMTPMTVDGHPDLSGYWLSGGGSHLLTRADDGSFLFNFGGGQRPATEPAAAPYARAPLSEPVYKPEFLAKVNEIIKNSDGTTTDSDPLYDCKPLGIPRAMASRDNEYTNLQILQTPPLIAVLFEGAPYSTFRLIYTDGRPHPKDLDSSYLGHTIGHWEGNTLVTDVVGLNDETWFGGGVSGQTYARIHSDREHVIERLTRQGDALTYEATVEDPVMFERPWVITPKILHHGGPDDAIIELTCTNEDKGHIVKPAK